MACSLCSTSNTELLFRINGFDIAKCQKCGFVFVALNGRKVNMSSIYSGYRSDAIIEKQVEHNAEITSEFLKETRRLGFKNFGRLLDVGCGLGFFLKAISCLVGECVSVEVSDNQAIYANEKLGVKVLKGEMTELALPRESFDVITLWDVIEHVSSPIKCLDECHRLLKEGGLIVISTPNYDSITRMIVGEKWLVLNPPEHLSYFTPTTLRKALEKEGFLPLYMSTKGLDVYNILQFTKITQKNKQQVWRQKSMEPYHPAKHKLAFRVFFKITVDRILDLLNIGDQITVYAVRHSPKHNKVTMKREKRKSRFKRGTSK